MYKNKNLKKAILSVFVVFVLAIATEVRVFAEQYGSEEYEIRFRIEKWVRVEDESDEWEDKVTNVAKDDLVEFKIKVTNLSDDEVDDFDDMKIEDFLPDEMYRVGGDGLTEYWDDFESGETKTFYIEARVEEDEYDGDTKDVCVVNKVELYEDDNFEGSDTATVCYNRSLSEGDVLGTTITELPDTGPTEIIALIGTAMIATGFAIKRKEAKRS